MAQQRRRSHRHFVPIPARESGAFINSVPSKVLLFPESPNKEARSITLRDVYSSVLRAINFLIGILNNCKVDDIRNFLSLFVNFQTSLNPFLSRNRNLRSITAALAQHIAEDVEAELSPDFTDLSTLCDLCFAASAVSMPQRERLNNILRKARRCLRKDDVYYYVPENNPVFAALRAGESIASCDEDEEESVWNRWFYQVSYARYAAFLGIDVDVDEFYKRTVFELTRLPFREEYAFDLYNVLTHTSYGLTLYNRLPMFGNDTANKLADRGMAFFAWLDQKGLHGQDPEILAGFVDAFLKGPSHGYSSRPEFGTIFCKILDAQKPDGRWSSKGHRGLYNTYHTTWVCTDALRPMQHDVLNPENRRLGLV